MTPKQKAYLQTSDDMRFWHHRQIGQRLGDVHTIQAHEPAIASIDALIDTKKPHAVQSEAEWFRVSREMVGAWP